MSRGDPSHILSPQAPTFPYHMLGLPALLKKKGLIAYSPLRASHLLLSLPGIFLPQIPASLLPFLRSLLKKGVPPYQRRLHWPPYGRTHITSVSFYPLYPTHSHYPGPLGVYLLTCLLSASKTGSFFSFVLCIIVPMPTIVPGMWSVFPKRVECMNVDWIPSSARGCY